MTGQDLGGNRVARAQVGQPLTVDVYCGAYVGPFMAFTEMPECGTTFTVTMDDPECPTKWWPCPKCGAECEAEWSHHGVHHGVSAATHPSDSGAGSG